MNITFKKKIPLIEKYDVIIAGGGPSGCASAIASAREGAKTLLIEATSMLGGMGTAGLVPAWCPFSDGESIIYRGIAEHIFKLSKEGVCHIKTNDVNWVPIDSERLKSVYDEEVINSGSEILLESFVVEVEIKNKSIERIIVSNKAGLTAYSAKIFIDCTGDGDLAYRAGAKYEMGESQTSEVQPATLCINLGNVDSYEYYFGQRMHLDELESPHKKIVFDKKYPHVNSEHCCNNFVGNSIVGFNAGHLWAVDSTDPESRTQAYIDGRKHAREFCNGLREYYPAAFANANLTQTASLMGIRESRRIIGEYVLTSEDYFSRASFEDEIARNCYYIDVHPSKKVMDEIAKGIDNRKFHEDKKPFKSGESHGIPYRCLIPQGIKNLLVAGRAISCDRETMGSIRVMPVCLVTGEAAGTAAGIAFQKGITDVRLVNIKELRKVLKKNGAYLPGK